MKVTICTYSSLHYIESSLDLAVNHLFRNFSLGPTMHDTNMDTSFTWEKKNRNPVIANLCYPSPDDEEVFFCVRCTEVFYHNSDLGNSFDSPA